MHTAGSTLFGGMCPETAHAVDPRAPPRPTLGRRLRTRTRSPEEGEETGRCGGREPEGVSLPRARGRRASLAIDRGAGWGQGEAREGSREVPAQETAELPDGEAGRLGRAACPRKVGERLGAARASAQLGQWLCAGGMATLPCLRCQSPLSDGAGCLLSGNPCGASPPLASPAHSLPSMSGSECLRGTEHPWPRLSRSARRRPAHDRDVVS
jgi:hypothetical protein